MIIGIDGNEANVKEKVGISEYAFELLTQFSRFKILDLRFKIYLKDIPKQDMPQETENWIYKIIGPRKLWTQIALPVHLLKDCRLKGRQISVFFSPTHYAPRFSPIPTVISIMDLSYAYYPQMFKASDLYQLKHWTSYSVKNAMRIFTISQASKNDIIKYYNIEPEKIVVTYPGIKLKNQSIRQAQDKKSKIKMTNQNAKLREKYEIEGEYVLFVGTLQPRKNIEKLIEAFARIKNPASRQGGQKSRIEDKDLTLVIVGKKGWMYEDILEAPNKFGVGENVKFLGFVSDENLDILYKNALFFVLPSLYEGFGLPVLEAMQNGCPVITSNVSSLPEAGGDAALYVDPKSVDDIAEKMTLLMQNEKLRKELIEKGYKQVKKFSWEKTAKETLTVLEEVVGNV